VPVDVFCADEQSHRAVEIERWAELVRGCLAAEGVEADAEVSVLFVDEDTIAELNSRFLGRQGPTDVLAFPIEDEPVRAGRSPDAGGPGPGDDLAEEDEVAPLLLGDIVICPLVAERNAAAHGVAFEDELALLVVHGVLHLLGMDHQEDGEAERMERREQELLDLLYRRSG
jgi:probable rRNA maturation factor